MNTCQTSIHMTKETQCLSEVLLKHYSCTGSHNAKLAQLTLRKDITMQTLWLTHRLIGVSGGAIVK